VPASPRSGGAAADEPVAIELLAGARARDAVLVAQLTDMINAAYATAERGLWREGATRTTASEVARLIAAGEIAVATRGGELAGSVRLRDVAPDASEFGLLAAAPARRGTGVGRALVDFAERSSRERGRRAIRLELLLPRTWRHPSKEALKAWYGRRGYRLAGTGSIDVAHPHLAPLLATPCEIAVYEKPLRDG
jgi:ribosomal protein S18 acetylase RimI-like enzyme